MQIYGKMDELLDKIDRNSDEITRLSRNHRSLARQEKRAKVEESKKRIHDVQIVPIAKEIERLKKENRELTEELRYHELAVIRVEKERRGVKGYLPTKRENQTFSIFSRFRRFANMEGFLAGREAEIRRELIEYRLADKLKAMCKQKGKKLNKKETETFYKSVDIPALENIIDETVQSIYDDLCNGRASVYPDAYEKEKGGLYRVKETTPSRPPETPNYDKVQEAQQRKTQTDEQR